MFSKKFISAQKYMVYPWNILRVIKRLIGWYVDDFRRTRANFAYKMSGLFHLWRNGATDTPG